MKKRLLSVFLCLCMVFGLVPATVWAETTTGHTHYLCGGSTCNGSGHENETYKTTFEKEIKQEGSVSAEAFDFAQTGAQEGMNPNEGPEAQEERESEAEDES